METLRTQLEENLDQAEWDWLEPHVDREAVIIVEKTLDLLDVGVAIASDNVSSVQHWISEELIHKPTPQEIAHWNDNRSQRFQALIVQPFVLIQEYSE